MDGITFEDYRKLNPEKSLQIVAMVPYEGGFLIATSGQIFHLVGGRFAPVRFTLKEHSND